MMRTADDVKDTGEHFKLLENLPLCTGGLVSDYWKIDLYVWMQALVCNLIRLYQVTCEMVAALKVCGLFVDHLCI